MQSTIGRQALSLVGQNRQAEAVALVNRHASRRDPESLFVRALWQIEGKVLARDVPKARQDLNIAAAEGNKQAARILAGLLATGTGAMPDWPAAVAMLESWSEVDPVAARQLVLIGAMKLDEAGDPTSSAKSVRLSESPDVIRFPDLFSAPECDFLREVAGKRFRRAQIFHEGKGQFVDDPIRDSDSASFPLVFELPVVHALNRRIAAASGTKVEQGETLQLLRYRRDQQYKPHVDAIVGLENQRELTMIVWLSEGYEGGETQFPETGLTVRGTKGDALLFRNSLPDGRPDPRSRHSGLPVTAGEKVIASRWIRSRPCENAEEGFGPHEIERGAPQERA